MYVLQCKTSIQKGIIFLYLLEKRKEFSKVGEEKSIKAKIKGGKEASNRSLEGIN